MSENPVNTFLPMADKTLLQYHAAEDTRLRHRMFRQREAVERPLVGTYRHSIYPMADLIQVFPEGEIQPGDLNPQQWLQVYEKTWETTGLMWGDLLHWASPLNGFPWMEAIAGCPVYASQESKSIWAGVPENFSPGEGVPLNPSNPWFVKLLESTAALVALSAGRFPVAPGIMRGISDLMMVLLGQNDFYILLKDEPEMLRTLADHLADFWIEVIKAQYQVIPAFDGGYVNAGLWMPDICPVYQEDAAALISAEDFKRVILPGTCRVLRAFDYPIMHFHSVGIHLVPAVLDCCPAFTVEVNIDPAGPPLKKLLPVFSQIQKAAPLEVFGTVKEVQACLDALSAEGMAYLILESSLEELDG